MYRMMLCEGCRRFHRYFHNVKKCRECGGVLRKATLDVRVRELLREYDGDHLHLIAADVIEECALEADEWTKRTDDAVRIPDMLRDTVRALNPE